MSYTPALRLRRDRQPHLVGDVLAIAIGAMVATTILLRGLMPGPATHHQAPGIDVVNTAPACSPTALPAEYC